MKQYTYKLYRGEERSQSQTQKHSSSSHNIIDLHTDIQNAFQKLDACINYQNRFTHMHVVEDHHLREQIKSLEEENKHLKEYAVSCQQDLTQLSSRFLDFFKRYSTWRYKFDLMKNENDKLHHLLKLYRIKYLRKDQNNDKTIQKSPSEFSADCSEHYSLIIEKIQSEKKQNSLNIYPELQLFMISTAKSTTPLPLLKQLDSMLKKNSDSQSISIQQLIRAFSTYFNQVNSQKVNTNQYSFPVVLPKRGYTIGTKKGPLQAKAGSNSELETGYLNGSMTNNSIDELPLISPTNSSPLRQSLSKDLVQLGRVIRDSKLFGQDSPRYSLREKVELLADYLRKQEEYISQVQKESQYITYRTEQSEFSDSPQKEQLFNFLSPQIKQQGRAYRSVSLKNHNH